MYHHQAWHAHGAGDRHDVTDEIEIQLVVERRVKGVRHTHGEQRMAVRSCAHDGLGGNVATSTRPVLDHELLAEALRQPLADWARIDIDSTAGRKADDYSHRPRWISLRRCDPREGWKCGSASGQRQKLPAVKLHGVSFARAIDWEA